MRDSFTIPHMLTEVLMNRRQDFSYILLEARNEDFWFNKFRTRSSKTIYSGSKDDVKRHAKILGGKGAKNYIGIIDSDFDRLFPPVDDYPANVFSTDTHDQETMTFSSRALDCYLRIHALDNELNAFEDRLKRPIIDTLVDSTVTLACIPFIGLRMSGGTSCVYDIGYMFDRYEEFVRKADLSIDVKRLLTINFLENQSKKEISYEALIDTKAEILQRMDSVWQFCNGHHMARILTVGLNSIFGRRPNANFAYRPSDVERQLSLLYDFEVFRTTQLHKKIVSWESKNNRKAVES